MFESKYPIIALGMNRVSDVNLALSVADAGAVPTITGFNYIDGNDNIDLITLVKHFNIYQKKQNNCNFIFSIDDKILHKNKNKLLEIFLEYNILYIELLINIDYFLKHYKDIESIINVLKNNNIKILTKLVSLENFSSDWTYFINKLFHGVIIKGPDGAGRITDNTAKDLKSILKQSISMFPKKFIIPCGGIGSAADVKELLDLGAGAVGIGTLFAASKESSLSLTAKEKIIKSSSNNLEKIKTHDFKQNALIFSNVSQSMVNNTEGLIKGIETGTEGHIFLGKSIDYVTEIKSVSEIVLNLVDF
jgi:NAD(P)H-dependent flavin oxidoreductase YrpB (nitropropane dioxygenase family)